MKMPKQKAGKRWLVFVGLLLAGAAVLMATLKRPKPLDIRVVGPSPIPGSSYYDTEDPNDLESGNPWKPGAFLTHLPIFYQKYLEQEPAPEQQLDCAQKFGALFGVGEITQHERVNQYFDFSGGQIEVENEGLLEIQFDSIPFPEPDWFPENTADAEYEQALKMLDVFLNRYAKILGIEKPVSCTLYDSAHLYRLYVEAYEGKGTLAEQFVAYHFNKVYFFYSGKSLSISRQTSDGLEKVGDYPIISLQKAQQMLEEGLYTSNPYGTETAFVSTLEQIVKTDLIYFTNYYNFTVPFYRFFVPMPYSVVGDFHLINFPCDKTVLQCYYVPAIPLEYVKDPSVFGMQFRNWKSRG